jgi:putative ABC transport system ATP-binding protein
MYTKSVHQKCRAKVYTKNIHALAKKMEDNINNPAIKSIISILRLIKTRPGKMPFFLKVARLIIKNRDRIALVGQSGSGKSTLLDMLALVLKPDVLDKGGEFIWKGGRPQALDIFQDWQGKTSSRREALRSHELGYVLQSGGLLPFLSVRDNILLPAQLKNSPRGISLENRLHYLADYLGIDHLLKKLPGVISVGERQRVAVARALIHSPSLLLADEPTASLDPPTAGKVFELFLELANETDAAIVLATHNQKQAERYGFTSYRIECVAKDDKIVSMLMEPKNSSDPSGKLIVVKSNKKT